MTRISNNPPPPLPVDDRRVRQAELAISIILRTGVVTSLTVVVAGVLISFCHHPNFLSSPRELQRLTRPGAAFPYSIGDVITGLRTLQGRAVVMVGLLLLIATPVMRVAVSILTFVYERDWVFVVITSTVLLLLLTSFVLGKAGG